MGVWLCIRARWRGVRVVSMGGCAVGGVTAAAPAVDTGDVVGCGGVVVGRMSVVVGVGVKGVMGWACGWCCC